MEECDVWVFEDYMRPTLVFVFVVLMSAPGCAALPRLSDSEQEDALARSENPSQAPADLIYGQSAAARGDWNTALAFFQRSYREKPSLLNEFNLATAYQRTGRGDLAVPLYLDLVDRGQLTEVTPIENTNGSFDQKAPASDIADEARERLIRMHASSLLTNRSAHALGGLARRAGKSGYERLCNHGRRALAHGFRMLVHKLGRDQAGCRLGYARLHARREPRLRTDGRIIEPLLIARDVGRTYFRVAVLARRFQILGGEDRFGALGVAHRHRQYRQRERDQGGDNRFGIPHESRLLESFVS